MLRVRKAGVTKEGMRKSAPDGVCHGIDVDESGYTAALADRRRSVMRKFSTSKPSLALRH